MNISVTTTSILTLALFLGMLILLEGGRRWGMRQLATHPGAEKPSLDAMEVAVYSLFSLLVAFTFNGAASRFDTRRQLIVEETNNIGTAYLRIDLLPAAAQPGLRDAFRRYLDSRIEIYRKLPDIQSARTELVRSQKIQSEIWSQSIVAGRDMPPPLEALFLSALNQMIDITTTRLMATQMHPPAMTYVMLFALALSTSLLAGHGMGGGRRSEIHMIIFAAIVAVTLYMILDIEFPRMGMIRVDSFDQALIDLRRSMD